MTPRPLGMNPEEVEQIAAQLRAAHAVLEHAQQTARKAASLSLSPLTYGVQPGGLLLAPAAIAGTQVAAAKMHDALGGVDHLIAVLGAEAHQQRTASAPGGGRGVGQRRRTKASQPPVNGTPAENYQWWLSLSDDQKQEFIEKNPAAIGNLDGIPAAARDKANREILKQMLADPNLDATTRRRLDSITEQLAGARDRYAAVQLVLLDFSEPSYPKVAISLGDSDTADYVSPLAFGINTNIDNLSDCMRAAEALEDKKERELQRANLTGSSATVMWLGYDSGNALTVHSDELAAKGGTDFASYLNGLDAVNPNARIVPVTHSYGTRMVSYALGAAGASADGVIMLGSPGVATGVRSVDDLNVPPDQVYASRAKTDLVSSAIYDRSSPVALLGPGASFAVNPDPTYQGVLGIGGFGAQVFSSENASFLGHDLLNENQQGYLAPGSEGLRVSAQVSLGLAA